MQSLENQVVAKVKNSQTALWLTIFLLGVAVVVFAGLFFDTLNKNRLLDEEVQTLQKSQVLLMVPDDQAEAIANWLASNPEQTQSLLQHAQTGQQTSVQLDTDGSLKSIDESKSRTEKSAGAPLLADSQQVIPEDGNGNATKQSNNQVKRDTQPLLEPKIVSDSKGDVKVITLPHGGIRVTTREEKN